MSAFASGVAVYSDGATIDAVSRTAKVIVENKGSGALVVEEKEPPRRKTGIQDLASECVVSILEFLRAVDLCSVSEVDRTVFSPGRLRLGISFQLNHLYPLAEKSGGAQQQHTPTKGGTPLSSPTTYGSYLHAYYLEHDQAGQERSGSAGSGGLASPDLLSSSSSISTPVPIRSNSLPGFSTQAGTSFSGTPPPCGSSPLSGHHKGLRSPSPTQLFESSAARPLSLGLGIDLLYTREIKSIIAALSSPQPLTGRCFWVSSGWIANAKKYYEALSLPDLTASSAIGHAGGGHRNKSGHKKSTKIRLRRGSDALPPWPQMNADLTCVHGRLSLAKCPKGKRRLMSASAWHLLRKFYPQGPVYPAGGSKGAVECHLCSKETDEAKLSASQEREKEITRRAEMIPERLLSLLSRKSGVPTELLAHRRPMSTEWEDARGERELGAGRATIHMAVKGGGESEPVASGLTLAMRQASIGTQGSVGIGEIAGKEGGLKEAPMPIAGGRPPLPRTPSFTVSNSPFDERRRHNSLTSCSTNSLDGYSSGSDYEDHDKFLEMYGKYQPSSPHDAGSDASPSSTSPSQPFLSRYHLPLLPGIYHLLPRDWLKRWRHYTKDPISTIPLLDCTSLLCHSHGLFVIPPHLEDYLLGLKRSLLGGLGQYPGIVVEIISLEEWEALHNQLRAEPDFCVRFCLSAEGDMAWNVGVCGACDPFTFNVNSTSPKRRTGESLRGGNGTHRGK